MYAYTGKSPDGRELHLSSSAVEWCMRKYTSSHRRIKQSDIDKLASVFLTDDFFEDMPEVIKKENPLLFS